MKVIIKDVVSQEEVIDLSKYIKRLCDGYADNGGAVEEAQTIADNTANLLAKLITLLTEKKMLSENDLLKLFKNDIYGIKLL